MTTEGCGGGERGRSPGDGPQKRPPFEKETVRLPDGRLLTFYRFPEEPKAPSPPADDDLGGPGRARRKER